jgi:hypothetical protein
MEPYLKIQNWNIFFPSNIDEKVVLKSMESKFDHLIRFGGRPLWRSICSGSEKFRSALAVAMIKLKGAESEMVNEESILLALAAARFACHVFPRFSISQVLTKSHMAVCYEVDRVKDHVFVGYPIEPMIGLAAQRLMATDDDCKMEKVLERLAKSLSVGIVASGERGELLARFILAEGYDRAVKNVKEAIIGINLETFFTSLFGKPYWKELKDQIYLEDGAAEKKALLEQGYICINQFVSCSYTPNITDMKQWFARGAAGISKPGQRGFDLFIPVWHKEKDYFTCILVSIKNKKDSSSSMDLNLASVRSSAFFSGLVTEYDKSFDNGKAPKLNDYGDDEMPLVYEKVTNPYIVLCLNFGGNWDKGFIETYPFDKYTEQYCISDIDKYKAKEMVKKKKNGKHRLPYNLVSSPNGNSIKAVIPRNKNQIVIGATGFMRDNNDYIFNVSEKSVKLFLKFLNVIPQSETVIADEKLSSLMLSIGYKPGRRLLK